MKGLIGPNDKETIAAVFSTPQKAEMYVKCIKIHDNRKYWVESWLVDYLAEGGESES